MSRMNNDLISRTAVLQILYDVKDDDDTPKNYGTLLDIIRQIRELPVAFDKEKVIEEMKKTGKRFCVSVRCSEDCQNCEHGVLMKALIEIVKKGGIE